MTINTGLAGDVQQKKKVGEKHNGLNIHLMKYFWTKHWMKYYLVQKGNVINKVKTRMLSKWIHVYVFMSIKRVRCMFTGTSKEKWCIYMLMDIGSVNIEEMQHRSEIGSVYILNLENKI